MKRLPVSTLKLLTLSPEGLSDKEVEAQGKKYGRNTIVEERISPLWQTLKDTLNDPMIWFLLLLGGVYLALHQNTEALTLLLAILPLAGMDAVLHMRTQASTQGLRGQLDATAAVIRGGIKINLSSEDIVPGDLLCLAPETFISADGIIEMAQDLLIEESALTGEATPVSKRACSRALLQEAQTKQDLLISESKIAYAGTRVLRGTGHVRVTATGAETAYGEIVRMVSQVTHQRTPLQDSIGRLVRVLLWGAGAFCVILAGVRWIQGHGWLDALLSAATLAVAAIPEEFPVIFSFYLGVGVYRLAKKGILVRRAVSVENIGRVDMICTDKTGTLTWGELKLAHVEAASPFLRDQILEFAALACPPQSSDPIDLAIIEATGKQALGGQTVIQRFPFTEDRRRETSVGRDAQGGFVVTKGAPEVILDVCALTLDEKSKWRTLTDDLAKEGYKVLACAKRSMAIEALQIHNEPSEAFTMLGLLAFEDPPREGVSEAISYCQAQNIAVLMLTGDHQVTAEAIARRIGLGKGSPRVTTGIALEHLIEHSILKTLDVVARCTPSQKLNIVTALRSEGRMVVVTGDGVNDVPALKVADIGIAMGKRGTRSAKEVSSMILSDDQFSTIVEAIKEGRQLFSNLRLSFIYLILFHIPFISAAALLPLLGYPLVFLPIHIVWLELMIHPSAMFGFQLHTKTDPIASRKTLFSASQVKKQGLVGGMTGLFLIGLFMGHVFWGSDIEQVRGLSMALMSLWSATLLFILSRFQNKMTLVCAAATLLTSVILIQVEGLAKWLHVKPLTWEQWFYVTLGILPIGWILWALDLSELKGRPRATVSLTQN